MGATLQRLMELVSHQSGVPLRKLTAQSAISQDIRISSDDIDELAEAIQNEFGGSVASWPWDRFCDLNEPHLFTGLWFLWRLITWHVRGRLFDPNPYERLELGHIAAVIDKSEWFEP
jgi:hypothetical protein